MHLPTVRTAECQSPGILTPSDPIKHSSRHCCEGFCGQIGATVSSPEDGEITPGDRESPGQSQEPHYAEEGRRGKEMGWRGGKKDLKLREGFSPPLASRTHKLRNTAASGG